MSKRWPFFQEKIRAGGDLSRDDMAAAMDEIVAGAVESAAIAEFLVTLRDKGESVSELSGLVAALRRHMRPLDLGTTDFIDTCGTGGTGKPRFNISTAASLIAVACGAKIAKHGNRAASSKSGSADFLEALGYPLKLAPDALRQRFQSTGFCFFFAPQFHPAMAKVAEARRLVGTKTIFNCVGPLLNPAGAKRQVIGVYGRERMRAMAEVLAEDPQAFAVLVHGRDGMDEVTLTDKSDLLYVEGGRIREAVLNPLDWGFSLCREGDLAGGTPQENAARFKALIDRPTPSPLRDVLSLNAALFLSVYRREMLGARHIAAIAACWDSPEPLSAILA